jgi:hypothetical protein
MAKGTLRRQTVMPNLVRHPRLLVWHARLLVYDCQRMIETWMPAFAGMTGSQVKAYSTWYH